jgi:hypothetical protein
MPYNENESTVAMTCIDGQCNRAGVQILDGSAACKECGGELFEYDSYEFEDIDENSPDDPHDLSITLERLYRSGREPEPVQRRVTPPNDTFSCPADLTTCPIALSAVVHIPLQMFNRWIFMANQISTEWIAYLLGKELPEEPGHYVVEDMYFPKQTANGGHCEAAPGEIRPGTIAAVHSHVGMNVFFSGEDIQHFNHPIELVVNRAGKVLGNGRVKLECGRWHRGPAKILFTECGEDLVLVQELKDKIVESPSNFNVLSDNLRFEVGE